MRTIDADALREVVEDHVTTVSVCPTVEHAYGRTAFKKIVLADIDAAPTVNTPDVPSVPDGGWISVDSRLPGDDDYRPCYGTPDGAVMWYNGKEIGFGWFYHSTDNWSDIHDDLVLGVTHWMPLPQVPFTPTVRRGRPKRNK